MKRILTWILAFVLAVCCLPAMAEECSHNWKIVDPTCGKDGRKLCTLCGESEVLPATGAHTMVVTKTATCAEEGEKTCSVCGYTEKIAKNENHNWKINEPTCGKDGMKLCAICGATEVLPATGEHDWIIRDAGCETEGRKLCSKCGATETIAPKGHDWVVGKEPTCTEAGDRVCVVCSKSEVLPASGHKVVKIPAEKATCKKEGSTEGEFCETCGLMLKEPQTVPVKKHSYYTKVVEPTADKSGYTLHTCRYCGRKYSSDRVEALGQGNDRIYGIVTDVNRIVKDYTLNTASEVAVINAAAEADGTFAARCLFLSEETVQKLAQAGCSEIHFTVGSASVAFPLNALEGMNGTVVITLSVNADATAIGVQATLDDEAATDVTEQLAGLTLTISNASRNAALAAESGRAMDAAFENGAWTIKVAAAETYTVR